MEEISTDNLFLIEFLVARVDIDPDMIRYAADDNAGTCVTVQFLDNSPLNICEEDFSPQSQYDKESENLKTGKSCLFSLTPEQVQNTLNEFDINVDIFKKNNQGEKIQVGTSLVPVTKIFKKLIRSYMSSNQPDACPVPPAEMVRDNFKINNSSGQYIGDINMYVRVSCFGKQIVTRFQMNPKEKSILFKDKAGHSLYKYKKVNNADESNLEDMSGADRLCGPRCPAGQCGMPSETGPVGCGSGCASAAAEAGSTGKRSKPSKGGGCCGNGSCSGGQCG